MLEIPGVIRKGRTPGIRLKLEEKLFREGEGWFRVGPLEVELSGGQRIELACPHAPSLRAVLRILSLQDLEWMGSLSIGVRDIRGIDAFRGGENRPWIFSSRIFRDSDTPRILLSRAAMRNGWGDDRFDSIVAEVAEQFDLDIALDTVVKRLNRVERQALSAALLNLADPAWIVVDGRDSLRPTLRPIIESLFNRSDRRSAVIVLSSAEDESWSDLSSARIHVPVEAIDERIERERRPQSLRSSGQRRHPSLATAPMG